MSVALTVEITKDDAGPLLQKFSGGLTPEARNELGRSVRDLVQKNFVKLQRSRANKLGGRRTNFYASARGATSHRTVGEDVIVAVSQLGVRQRLMGGTIRPVKAKWLAIPARAEAYAKSPREFGNLRFALIGGAAALVRKDATRLILGRRGKDGQRKVKGTETVGGEVMFWLRKKVTQRPDPTVLPSQEDLKAAALAGLQRWVRMLLRKEGGKA